MFRTAFDDSCRYHDYEELYNYLERGVKSDVDNREDSCHTPAFSTTEDLHWTKSLWYCISRQKKTVQIAADLQRLTTHL